jgi:hypothetical protein
MQNQSGQATFKLDGLPVGAVAEVLGEKRSVSVREGGLSDDFKPYEVHLYRIAGKP